MDRHHELLISVSHDRLRPAQSALVRHAAAHSSVSNTTAIHAGAGVHRNRVRTEAGVFDRYPVCLVLLLMSCRHSPDDTTQGTTAQIVHAVEMTRQASNHDKRGWLDQLRNLPCKLDDVCQLKDLCTKAYDSHLIGVDSIDQARAIVSGPAGSGSAADASAEPLLDALTRAQTAQRQLKSAKQQTQACAENEAVIRQRYRL